MKIGYVLAGVAGISAAFVSSANAAVVIHDDFSGDTPALNWTGDSIFAPTVPPVQGGPSVDLVGPSNPYGITTIGGLNVVDMDGSTGSGNVPIAGDIQSVASLATGNYTVSFWISGNQRIDVPRSVDVTIDGQTQTIGPLGENAPWTFETLTFKGVSGNVLFSEPGPSNQQGDLITDITVSSGIPEPSTWVMMAAGLAGLGFAAFRKPRRPNAIV